VVSAIIAVLVALLAGCDSNPDSPRVPKDAATIERDGQAAPGAAVRQRVSVTKVGRKRISVPPCEKSSEAKLEQ
jgi:hypothetical protein